MTNISALLSWIFFGDFGLFTLTPRYLFLVLFPIMIALELFGQIMPKLPFLQKTGPLANQFFYGVLGLGCTTAAIVSLDFISDPPMKSRMIWLLILLIPCSSQLAIIATFAAMVALRVFLVYLIICLVVIAMIYFAVSKIYPLSSGLVRPSSTETHLSPVRAVKKAFASVVETIAPFSLGSVIISIISYTGLLDMFQNTCGPFMEKFLHLPPDAAGLLILNILKRDFGSASLLSLTGKGAFDAVQLVVLLVMMTFSVPCFNSAMVLIKQQRLPRACFLWLGSLAISILIGRIVSSILLILFV